MKVQMTCACGKQQEVASDLAGKTTPCLACGQPLSVPAMGVAVPAGRKRPAAVVPLSTASPFAIAPTVTPAHKHARGVSSRWANGLLIGICGLLLLATLAVGALLLGLHEPMLNMVRVAKTAPPPVAKDSPPSAKTEERDRVPADSPVNKPADPVTPSADSPVGKPIDTEPTIARPDGKKDPTLAKPPEEKKDPTVAKPPDVAKSPVEEKPAKPAVKGPFKEGESFLQDLLVTQKSRFAVQGLPVATMLQYRIGSRYTVQKVHESGALSVEQKIEASALTTADDVTQGLLLGALSRLPGTKFALEISPRGEVTKFVGAGGAPRFGGAKLPGGLGVQMASLLDADGWKEMAQATFYQPEQLDKPGQWTRSLTHNWGPLGGWTGHVSYAYPGPGKIPQVKVPYTLKIAYQPPKGPGAPGALPFQISGSNFQLPEAGGTLLFDTDCGKVIAAEERFFVRGTLALMLLGQNTPTEIEEEQTFQLRIADKQ